MIMREFCEFNAGIKQGENKGSAVFPVSCTETEGMLWLDNQTLQKDRKAPNSQSFVSYKIPFIR